MDKNREKKLKNYLSIIVLICVFIMFLGTYCVYYVKNNKNEHIKENKVLMTLNFDGKNEINVKNINPGWSDKIIFSVVNHTKDTIGRYKLVLEIVTPFSNMIEENLVYTINGESLNKDKANIVAHEDESILPVFNKTFSDCVITPNNTHNYVFNIDFKKDKTNKKYTDNMLVLKIKLASEDN